MKLKREQDAFVGAQYIAPHLGLICKIKPPLVSAVLLLLSVFVAPSVLGDCKCGTVKEEEITRWGGNEVVIQVEEKTYRQLSGTVQMFGDRPLKDVLVEIFDRPGYLLNRSAPFKRYDPEQKRVAACRTSADGKFCFRDLPSGKYELRSSIDSGWNVTQLYVVVDKKAGQTKKIQVRMSVGT
jgi:hypothetical protein